MNYSLVSVATLLLFLPALLLEVIAEKNANPTTWAVLVAGSKGYVNYRHQANVCHAYQILKKGGLKDENIIVFMYNDIATDNLNPHRGVIINHPRGKDVYRGVPRDYTGKTVTAHNLYAVLLGNKKLVRGGSGKVVNSKPDDRIFLYFSGHGAPGVLGMPDPPLVFANDLIQTLKKKHESKTYKEMVLYVEACNSGSLFDGTMPEDLGIYVTSSATPMEKSYATYCPKSEIPPPPEYTICLSGWYSAAWMEDSETHNLMKETLGQQYETVKERIKDSSTVMEYGNKSLKAEKVYLYQGYDPATKDFPPNKDLNQAQVVDQGDVDIIYLWEKYERATGGSEEKQQVFKEITDETKHRAHLDTSIQLVGSLLFGLQNGSSVLNRVRAQGLPLVDDWDCLKSMVRVFEDKCGSLAQYGMKHMRAFANVCNNGVSHNTMEEACATACNGDDISKAWHPSVRGGYSA